MLRHFDSALFAISQKLELDYEPIDAGLKPVDGGEDSL